MTPRCGHRPLASHPPQALTELRSHVAALLSCQDMLPTDLYIKLDLLHGDISRAIHQGDRRAPVFPPHPGAPAVPLPGGRAPRDSGIPLEGRNSHA